jgi:leucyl-tRNA synthetase
MTTNQHRTIAVLGLPQHVPDLIKKAQAIVEAMTNNPLFPNPTPSLATVSAAIAKLDTAETATKTRTKGTVEERNAARAEAISALHELLAYVQQVSDANRAQAETIITSAAMSLKKPTTRSKQDFEAKPGANSGWVHLVARAPSHRASYVWQWSSDGGKTWQTAPMTLQSKTTILGLPVAVVCQFRFRAVTKAGEGDWSQVVTLLVK